MKSAVTIQLEDQVRRRLGELSRVGGGYTRMNRSLNQWIAEYALPRFCSYEEQRNKRRKARIDREIKELWRRAHEVEHVRALDEDEMQEGMDLMDRLSEGGELNEEEQTKAVEMLAALLARRKMNRLHARALEEDEIREAVKLADRLRACGELSAREHQQVENILRG
jgi:predicted transcriptional regulator